MKGGCKVVWAGYGGQDVTGYNYIGTDTPRYPLTDGYDVKKTVEEIRWCCGRPACTKLFKEESDEVDGDW